MGGFKDVPVELVPDDKYVFITPDLLDLAISKTKSKKSVGIDGIPMIVMKDTYPVLKYATLTFSIIS